MFMQVFFQHPSMLHPTLPPFRLPLMLLPQYVREQGTSILLHVQRLQVIHRSSLQETAIRSPISRARSDNKEDSSGQKVDPLEKWPKGARKQAKKWPKRGQSRIAFDSLQMGFWYQTSHGENHINWMKSTDLQILHQLTAEQYYAPDQPLCDVIRFRLHGTESRSYLH